eukprot:2642077-Alexandrium_andersonii.AAC.1
MGGVPGRSGAPPWRSQELFGPAFPPRNILLTNVRGKTLPAEHMGRTSAVVVNTRPTMNERHPAANDTASTWVARAAM